MDQGAALTAMKVAGVSCRLLLLARRVNSRAVWAGKMDDQLEIIVHAPPWYTDEQPDQPPRRERPSQEQSGHASARSVTIIATGTGDARQRQAHRRGRRKTYSVPKQQAKHRAAPRGRLRDSAALLRSRLRRRKWTRPKGMLTCVSWPARALLTEVHNARLFHCPKHD